MKYRFSACIFFILAVATFLLYFSSNHRIPLMEILAAPREGDVEEGRCLRRNLTHETCLPNVMIVGCSKAGTTSIVNYLSQHPNVFFIRRRGHQRVGDREVHREVHRFDRHTYSYALKSAELADEWISAPTFPVASGVPAVIHYTPHYLYVDSVPLRIKNFYAYSSHLKFVAMLRDPSQRTLSSYWFKHSHLFGSSDTGNVSDFVRTVLRDVERRMRYEKCMTQHSSSNSYSKGPLHLAVQAAFEGSERQLKTIARVLESSEIQTNPGLQRGKLYSSCRAYYHIFRYYGSNLAQKDLIMLLARRRPLDLDYLIAPIDAFLKINHSQMQSQSEEKQQKNYVRNHFMAVNTCFNDERLATRLLGLRHVDKSIYADQLLRWFLLFPNPERFLVLYLEEFAQSPHTQLSRVLKFMGVQTNDLALQGISFRDKKLSQPNSIYRKLIHDNHTISLIRVTLDAFFAPYNVLTAALLRRL